ncbi:MAG: YceI family protein [Opitutaceae bacterium]|nr:YceI family protein [Opitutaceae bacterium]
MKRLLLLVASLGLLASARADLVAHQIDTRHSAVSFSVRNFLIPVPGSLKITEGAIKFDAQNPAASSVEAVVGIDTINTQEKGRDDHLKNPDFFDTAKFPTARFKSTQWEVVGENKFKVTGDLTIKDVTKPLTFEVTYFGTMPGNRGRTVSGWEAVAKLDRRDFGISYGTSIGNEVALTITVQGFLPEGTK